MDRSRIQKTSGAVFVFSAGPATAMSIERGLELVSWGLPVLWSIAATAAVIFLAAWEPVHRRVGQAIPFRLVGREELAALRQTLTVGERQDEPNVAVPESQPETESEDSFLQLPDGRYVLNRSPAELWRELAQLTSIQQRERLRALNDQERWIRATGTVEEVTESVETPLGEDKEVTYWEVKVATGGVSVEALFEGEAVAQGVRSLQKGEQVSILGKPRTWPSWCLGLYDCELESE